MHPSTCLWGTSPAWPYRQLILVTPHTSALPLFDHSFDVHQHWQRHAARSETEEREQGLKQWDHRNQQRISTLSQTGPETKVSSSVKSDWFLNYLILIYVCKCVLTCMYVDHMHAQARRVVRSPGTIGNESCEPSCGYWESNSGPQKVFLIPTPSLLLPDF